MDFFSVLGMIFIAAGIPFFLSGTVGLLRFPDLYTRLHALTKADNVGLGFIILGLCCTADDFQTVLKLVTIWFLVLVANSAGGHLIARTGHQKKITPWQKR